MGVCEHITTRIMRSKTYDYKMEGLWELIVVAAILCLDCGKITRAKPSVRTISSVCEINDIDLGCEGYVFSDETPPECHQ